MAATTHHLWVKQFVLPLIEDGSKDLEVRVLSPPLLAVQTGDLIVFNNVCQRRVKAIRQYPNFEKMLNSEDPARIFPKADQKQILQGLRRIYQNRDQRGVMVLEFEPL